VTARLARVIGWLRARLSMHPRGRCGCPFCHKAERDARAAIGMPARHPERITRDLPGGQVFLLPAGQEEYLAALAGALWPEDEYATIIAELWREDRP
jgi:hypothetical protein